MSENNSTNERKHSSGTRMWKVIGGAALVLFATGVIYSLHDIRRYIRMLRM